MVSKNYRFVAHSKFKMFATQKDDMRSEMLNFKHKHNMLIGCLALVYLVNFIFFFDLDCYFVSTETQSFFKIFTFACHLLCQVIGTSSRIKPTNY